MTVYPFRYDTVSIYSPNNSDCTQRDFLLRLFNYGSNHPSVGD